MQQFNVPVRVTPQTLPGASTALITQDCEVDALVFCNTTAGAVTVTVTDGNGKNLINGMSIPANTTVQVPFSLPGPVEKGQFLQGGVKWLAGAAASIDASGMFRVAGA